ncbi:MAG: ABC transporter permease [Bacteroidetes bacterium]|nr:ABC transporter permease [Bacteroidota bacterium]
MKPHPPKLADKLLEWCAQHAPIEDLQGDAHENFYRNLTHMSAARAKADYWKNTLSLIFSYALKKRKKNAAYPHYSSNLFQLTMFKNYFVIATRSLIKHKFFTAINVMGLAVGMSIGLLFIAMMSFLWTYDNFHTNKDRIYRVISKTDDKQRNREFASAPAALADKLSHDISGVEAVVRVNSTLSVNAKKDNNEIPLNGYFVDPVFLNVFSFPLTKGNPHTALNKPNGVVITESAATKLFNQEDPLGKVIELTNLGLVEITGVLQNIPKNSHMQFEVLAPYEAFVNLNRNQPTAPVDDVWEHRNSYVYLFLSPKSTLDQIQDFLNRIPKNSYTQKANYEIGYELQALPAIAPGRELYNDIGPDWSYASLSIFLVLTLLILIPACFNYANISISRALKRMKEIGLRKTLGGTRQHIFSQFIIETILITFLAFGFSCYIFILVRKEFLSMIVGGSSTLSLNLDARSITAFILFALVVGLIAGAVPATYFAKLNPIQALKLQPIGKGIAKFNLRKTLIVLQFALSLGFIMGVVTVISQYRYTVNFDFGFNQKNILDVALQGVNPQHAKNEFAKLAAVKSISMSSGIIGSSASETIWVKNATADSTEVAQFYADGSFLDNLHLTLLAGKTFADDSLSKEWVIVNEQFLKSFKLPTPASAIGQRITLPNGNELTVIGVVKDFHYTDLRSPIRSFFFRYNPQEFRYANLNLTSTDLIETVGGIEASWKKLDTEAKFAAQFFDDEIEESYSFYFVIVKLFGFLGMLAITISCLGLLGMVVFTVENRMKEIGVRKVMGASTLNITVVLSKDFVKLMLLAALIAIPIGYVFFNNLYLQTQYYHITVGFTEIAGSLLILFVLGLSTIFSQTIKAARVNAVDTLRCE